MAKEYKPYWEKLKDPRWQRRRLEIMRRDNFTCLECKSATNTLNVHHCYYIKGADPWEHPDSALKTLCEDCHNDATLVKAAFEQIVFTLPIELQIGFFEMARMECELLDCDWPEAVANLIRWVHAEQHRRRAGKEPPNA